MRRYKVLLPLRVHTEDNSYGQGEEFEKDFTEEEETANVSSGLLELLPMRYKVVGLSEVHGTQPGDTFEMALPLGQEALLVEGGHIKRVGGPRPEPDADDEPVKPAPKPRKSAAKPKE